MGIHIVDGPLSKWEEIMLEEGLMNKSKDYLQGYIDSYRKNKGLVRRTLESLHMIEEPERIFAYEKVLISKDFEEARKK